MKVYIWGTGSNTKKMLAEDGVVDIEGYIESSPTKEFFNGKKIYGAVDSFEYDAIIIQSIYVTEIFELAKRMNFNLNKLIFMYYVEGMKNYDNSALARKILSEKYYQKYVCEYKLIEKSFFAEDRKKYSEMNTRKTFEIEIENEHPILYDKYDNAGTVHSYFWQDLWAASLIAKNKPKEHFDIGSRLDGFLAHIISMGIPLKVIDVRPFPVAINGMTTIVDDATNLVQIEDNSIQSLSALCSLEHFGLGRYGDLIDPEACFKCFSKIQDKVVRGGHIYISVPIGKEKVQFNAHRIFFVRTIRECFNRCVPIEISACDDNGIESYIDNNKYDKEDNNGGRFGLFHFQKK